MTTEYRPRLFERDSDIRTLGERLLACALPREAWTHEAHLGACLWLLTERPDIDVDAGIAHFRAKLPAEADAAEDLESTLPAQVLVNLLVRLDRLDEAVDVAAERLGNVPDSLLACPPLACSCFRRRSRMIRTPLAVRTATP